MLERLAEQASAALSHSRLSCALQTVILSVGAGPRSEPAAESKDPAPPSV